MSDRSIRTAWNVSVGSPAEAPARATPSQVAANAAWPPTVSAPYVTLPAPPALGSVETLAQNGAIIFSSPASPPASASGAKAGSLVSNVKLPLLLT